MENNDNSDSCKEKTNLRRQKSGIGTNKQKMKKVGVIRRKRKRKKMMDKQVLNKKDMSSNKKGKGNQEKTKEKE